MANYNKQNPDVKLLKASFCRQLFPDLLQFLRDFDISETPGGTPQDSLNMHFLLQAYQYNVQSSWINKIESKVEQEKEHQKEIDTLKETCKWSLSDVEEKDVLLAVDEYFDITSKYRDLSDLRNALVENAIIGKTKKEWKFEDNTTLRIINHFGINPTKTEIGYQRKAFSLFVRNAKGLRNDKNAPDIAFDKSFFNEYEELCFTNAFHLLRCLRNWGGHEWEDFNADEKIRYYRFILFTHIGITYVCRRLWNKYGEALSLIKEESKKNNESKKKYKKPDTLILKDDKVEVIITANKSNDNISECEYQIVGQKRVLLNDIKGNEVKFSVDVPKYVPFTIKFRCEGFVYEITRCMTYYAWNPTLTISVQPPAKIHCICKGIAGEDESLEKIIGDLFTQYLGTFSCSEITKEQKDANNKILQQLATIEPLLRDIHELSKKNEKENLELLRKTDEAQNQLTKLNENLKPVYGNISDTVVGVKVIIDILKSWERAFRGGLIAIFMIIAGWWFYSCCLNDISTNLFWLKNILILLIVALAFTCLSFRLLKNTLKLKYCIPAILFFVLIGSPFLLLKYPSISTLVKDYNFAENKNAENQEVVSLLEKVWENDKDNEGVIIKLANYYLNYTGEEDRAWDIIQTLLKDPDVHKQSLVTIAESYFAKGLYVEVSDIVKRCKELQIPAVIRLEGLLFATPAVNELNYQKGDSLLKLAAQQGDVEALYWLGHLRSNAFGSWSSTYQGGEKLFSLEAMDYDLFASINYLRQAANKNYPKAALELGNIYLDLNINDSAKVYYEKALEVSDRNIKKEVYYRLGLLEERRGDSISPNMQKAIELQYDPALLHRAINSEKENILYYEKMEKHGGYRGYRYIPPIVFRRLNKDMKDSILIYLQRAHPNDNIDNRFVDAVEAVYTTDSIANERGRQMMRSLSHQNAFAKVLTVYWDLKKQTASSGNNSQIVKENISILESLGKEIPFAYALAAFVLKEMGPDYFDESDKFAQKAIIAGHPAGAVVLSYIPKSYYAKIEEEIKAFHQNGVVTQNLILPWNREKVSQLIKIRNRINLALRMSQPSWMSRTVFVNYGQKIDYILYATTKDGKPANDTMVINSNYPEENLRFWSNVAMNNNDFDNEGWMCFQYHRLSNKNIGIDCREQLIDSMLHCIFVGNSFLDLPYEKQKSDEQSKNVIYAYPYISIVKDKKGDTRIVESNLSNYLSEVPETFRNDMITKYGSDKMIKRILENKQIYDKLSILGTIPYNGSNHIWFEGDDKGLLEEWSAVDEGRVNIEVHVTKK